MEHGRQYCGYVLHENQGALHSFPCHGNLQLPRRHGLIPRKAVRQKAQNVPLVIGMNRSGFAGDLQPD
jgi:hypothetical protein